MTILLKRSVRILRWGILTVFALLGVIFVGLLLIQNYFASFLQDYVRTKFGLTLKIGSAEIQFKPLSIRLESIEISAQNNQPFFRAKGASADLPYSSFWNDEFLVHQIVLDTPRFNLDVFPIGKESTKKSGEGGKKFRIQNAVIHDGEVKFEKHNLKNIEMKSRIDSQGMVVQEFETKFNDINLKLEGSCKDWDNLEVDVSYETHGDAAGIVSMVPSIGNWKGPFEASGNVQGELKQALIFGTVKSSQMILEHGPPFTFVAEYKYKIGEELQPFSLTANFESFPIHVLGTRWKQIPEVASIGNGRIQYSGNSDFWNGTGNFQLMMVSGTSKGLPLSGYINAALRNGAIQIQHADLKLLASRLNVNGLLTQDRLSLTADFQSSRLKDIAFLSPKLASLPGTYRAEAKLSGPYNNINAEGLLSGNSGNSTIQANVKTSTGTKVISAQFQGNVDNEVLKSVLPAFQKGNVVYEGSVAGTWKNPVVSASLTASDLEFRKFKLQQFSSKITTENNNLLFHAEAPELQFAADGSYALTSRNYKLQGKMAGADARVLSVFLDDAADIQGKIYTDFEASGNIGRWKESTASVRMRMPELQWKDVALQVPETEIHVQERTALISSRILSPNGQMEIKGKASLQPQLPLDLQVKGKINGELLEKISADWKGEGEFNLNATILGPISRPKVEGKLLTENFSADYLPNKATIFLNSAEINLSNQILTLNGTGSLNNSTMTFKGNLPLQNDEGDLHFEISNLPVRSLNSPPSVSGNISMVGDFRGKGFPFRHWNKASYTNLPFNDWAGSMSITPTELKLGKHDISVETPLLVRIENRVLHLSHAEIQSGELLNFQGSGNLNLNTGEIQSTARLEARIDLLSSLKADIQSSGPLILDATVGGTIKDPEYNGTIQLSNASLRIPNSPLTLENLDLLAHVDGDRIKLDKLEARSGGGLISGGGEIVRNRQGSEVWIQGKNVAANYPEGLRSQVDFDLKLSALRSGVLLSGDVQVLRSLYEQELTPWNPIVRKLLATSKKLTAEKEFENKLKLAINVKTVQDFRLKNNSAILRAGGNLKVDGSFYRPVLSGSLNIREGSRIFISGNQYDVEKATIEFFPTETIEPNLDITLSSLLRDFETDTYYEVSIPFGGTPSNIEFKNVRSTPSLSQDQIFSLLTEGTLESQKTGSSGVFQQQLLSFFAGQTLGVPTATIAKSVGLSRIKVQQEGLHSVNDPKTRLMLGKDIGAGFSLIYSFVLNDPDEQTWIATYRYGRNIIGRFIDQDDDTFTVSVSHKIPFGKGVKQTSPSYDSRKKDRGSRIDSIEVKNDSPLTDKQINGILKTDAGDFYDYWDFQDHVEDLKKELQELGYLYPSIDVRENESSDNSIALKVEIRSGTQSEMIFNGFELSKKLLNRYTGMWRSGISALVVQQMIKEDLLHELQLKGHHQASVNTSIKQSEAKTAYLFDVMPGVQFQSVELKFEDAKNYDPAELQNDALELYRSHGELFLEAIHDPADFSEKIKMLYAQHGYLRSVVEPGSIEFSNGGKITRVIRVKEGAISEIKAVRISGVQAFPDSLQANLQLREGSLFIPDAILVDEQNIRKFYESSGHEHVSVHYDLEFQKNSSNLHLKWVLSAGPVIRIASIRVEGNQSTRTDLILNQLRFQKGDVLTQQSRSVAKKRLSDLGIFQHSEIETQQTNVPGWYDVVVHVTENKRYEFQYGGRYNTDDKAGVELRLTDFNFLGRAQNFSLYGRSTLDLPLFRVDYTLPVTGSFWDRTRFSIFRDQTDEDVRATVSGDLIKIPFEHRQLTFQFQQDYRLWTNYRLIWSFEYGGQEADFEDLLSASPRQFTGTEALFRSAFVADRRDDPLNASHGYFYSINGEYAPIMFGTDISYLKNFSQVFYYRKFGKIINAVGVRAGFLKIRSNILTVSEKFRTGGSTTLRGFVHNTVIPGDDPISVFFGGDSVFIFNEEIRFPVYKWLTGAVFYDAGNVYLRASDFDPTDLRHSAGFGFRVGGGGFVLRFDLGFNLDPEEDESQTVFHFGIGQAF